MGTVRIEIPQNINLNYRLVSEKSVRELLSTVETLVKNEKSAEDDDILGLWTDINHQQSAPREV